MLDDWVQEVATALDIEDEIDTKALLDSARIVAHRVERRAAPVTAYLIGVAVERRGGGKELIGDIAQEVIQLAIRREPPEEKEEGH